MGASWAEQKGSTQSTGWEELCKFILKLEVKNQNEKFQTFQVEGRHIPHRLQGPTILTQSQLWCLLTGGPSTHLQVTHCENSVRQPGSPLENRRRSSSVPALCQGPACSIAGVTHPYGRPAWRYPWSHCTDEQTCPRTQSWIQTETVQLHSPCPFQWPLLIIPDMRQLMTSVGIEF